MSKIYLTIYDTHMHTWSFTSMCPSESRSLNRSIQNCPPPSRQFLQNRSILCSQEKYYNDDTINDHFSIAKKWYDSDNSSNYNISPSLLKCRSQLRFYTISFQVIFNNMWTSHKFIKSSLVYIYFHTRRVTIIISRHCADSVSFRLCCIQNAIFNRN